MIQAVPATKLPSVPTAGRGVPTPRRFALSLAAAPAGDDGTDPPDADATVDGKTRHDAADDGNDLPNGDAPVDPRLIWLTMPVAVPVETPPSAVAGAPIAVTTAANVATAPSGPDVTFAGFPTPTPQAAVPDAGSLPLATPPAAEAAAMPLTVVGDGSSAAGQPTLATDSSDVAPTDARATPAGPLPIALPDPARPAAATSALQAFAGAMRAGWKADDQGKKDESDPLSAPGATALAPLETVRHAVAATGAAQDQTLDTRREHWPSTMIDHIEALRDSADATSSRIRVVPDALGTIDLSVKRDGDTLHVHFSAEQAATRTMLADAQPRLAEIAQSRGLRLGDTNVGGGGDGAQQQRPPARTTPLSPTPAPTRATSAAVAADETRIA